jgi:hypothetical protein
VEANHITKIAKNLGGVISKNSPVILTSISVTGVFATTILAVKATPKALEIIDEHRLWKSGEDDTFIYGDKTNSPLPKKDIIKLTWKCYIPAVVTGGATIACIVGSNHISLRRNAALASLYGLTETAFKEYKAKVVETIGKNKELKVRDDIAADTIKNNPPVTNEVIITGKGDVLCYDSLSGRYFKSDIEKIRQAVYILNQNLIRDMFITLNDLYYELGLSQIPLGDNVGWNISENHIEMDFSSQLTPDNEPCLVLNYDTTPIFI